MLQVCVLAAAGVFAALIIKKDKPEFAALIILLVSFLIAIRVLAILENALLEIESWQELIGENMNYMTLLFKLIGITYICDFAANLCKDSGYSSLSNHIEIFGKVAIMAAGFPVIRMMIDMLEGMMR
ncbi:MAG: stage III sporulation AC/AD family protein [Lachnospiraceae bacterium]|nr:stage III sporulation AC/AD family protein [Lachnospiraceae bacterium]MBO5146767.1 stage III sporulation AC/AD family protein [Lachnospiraceae bacterium]